MGRIPGHYEWDDDDLTPGKKKEGGLHQNLFDADGNLRGNARFIPDDGDVPPVVTETVFVPVEQRRRSREDEELERIVRDLVARLIIEGAVRAKPLVEQWWREKGRPAIEARRDKIRQRRLRRAASKKTSAIEVAEPSAESEESDGGRVDVTDDDRPAMSQAEAQARYLAALAARAFSEEQMRLVADARIMTDEDSVSLAELQRSLGELPAAQLRALVEAMAADPSLLSEDSLADLASILGRRALG